MRVDTSATVTVKGPRAQSYIHNISVKYIHNIWGDEIIHRTPPHVWDCCHSERSERGKPVVDRRLFYSIERRGCELPERLCIFCCCIFSLSIFDYLYFNTNLPHIFVFFIFNFHILYF